ncbi:MAG: 50S ribosomal protein L24 [Nitrososphaerota archaeon]
MQSAQPSKVRKFIFSADSFRRRKFVSAHLNKELREKYRRRSISLRKGDTVKIMRGDFKGVEGKVQKVYPAEGKVTVEGVTREKVGGGNVQLKIAASKVMITNLNLDDKIRRKKLEAKGGSDKNG